MSEIGRPMIVAAGCLAVHWTFWATAILIMPVLRVTPRIRHDFF